MADIQLSSQLFQDIQQAVERQEPGADQGVVMQYLAAVMGYLLGSQKDMSDADRDAYLDELFGFAKHVVGDVSQRHAPRCHRLFDPGGGPRHSGNQAGMPSHRISHAFEWYRVAR